MNFQPRDFEDLRARLLRVEKQNSRLKQIGAVALIVPVLLFIMGQAPSKKTVEANEFVLMDDSGNARAKMSMGVPADAAPGYPASPQLVLYDEKGKPRVKLDGDIMMPGLTVYDSQGRDRGDLRVVLDRATLLLSDEHGTLKTRLKEGEVLADEIDAGHVQTLDAEGFEAILGTADLVTPRTADKHKTSAASLILFDKDKNVIWKAP